MVVTETEVKRLLEAGVHFGHRTDKWNPKMKQFIFGPRNGIYIIDLSKTAEQVRKATDFLREASAKGGRVLFVGTKKPGEKTAFVAQVLPLNQLEALQGQGCQAGLTPM